MSIESLLAQLEAQDLIRRAPDGESYIFKHALTQDTVYESLLRKKRRALHRQVAETYEQAFQDQLEPYTPLLARHYAAAGDDPKTLEYATRSGELTARVYANAEAITHYSLALEAAKRLALEDSEQWIMLYIQRGRAYELTGRYQEALANYEEMESEARVRQDRRLELAAVIALASLYSLGGYKMDSGRAEAFCDHALLLAQELGDHKAQARILWTLLFLNTYLTNRPQRAVEYGEQSLAIAREYNLREQMAYTRHNLGYALVQIGKMKRAAENFAQARELWRELNNLPLLADNLAVSAMNEFVMGQGEGTLPRVQEAARINESIDNPWGMTLSSFVQGVIHTELGEPDRAIQAFRDSIRTGDPVHAMGMALSARCYLADLLGRLGAIDRGIETAQDAVAYANANFGWWEPWARAVLTKLYLANGDRVQAEQASREGWPESLADYFGRFIPPGGMSTAAARIELALVQQGFVRALELAGELLRLTDENDLALYNASARYLKGKILLAQSQTEEAYSLFESARERAEALDARFVLLDTLIALVAVETRRGHPDRAREHQERAREVIQFIGAHTPADLQPLFLGMTRLEEILHENS
ncbi:MAG: hypothetical protein WCF84_11475 [Anaerolineae bacterium]